MFESPTPTPRSLNEPAQRTFPATVVGISGGIIAVVLTILVALGTRRQATNPNQEQPLAPYAGSLALSQLVMSESTSLSGGKSTFLDGHVTNRGTQTVSGITVQVFFRNDEGLAPHLETQAVALIRTREPYIDTQPVSANPLRPGEERDFRLIFEALPDNWNTQLPDVHVTRVATR